MTRAPPVPCDGSGWSGGIGTWEVPNCENLKISASIYTDISTQTLSVVRLNIQTACRMSNFCIDVS